MKMKMGDFIVLPAWLRTDRANLHFISVILCQKVSSRVENLPLGNDSSRGKNRITEVVLRLCIRASNLRANICT